MKYIKFIIIISTFLVSLSLVGIQIVNAHVPIEPGEGETLETASIIPDATKSWVVYGTLHEGGEAHYYTFEIEEGQRMYFSLFIPTSMMDNNFLPGVVLVGPGLESGGEVPEFIETPDNLGVQVIPGVRPESADFEPFTPGVLYELLSVDTIATTTGTYYLVVYDTIQGGNFGVAVGFVESFTLSEWITVPVALVSIYQWEGQNLAILITPYILALGLWLIMLRVRQPIKSSQNFLDLLGSITGILFLGSGFSFGIQLIMKLFIAPSPGGLISVIFAVIPVYLGLITFRLLSTDQWYNKSPLKLGIIGIIALFTWTGLIIGPILAIVTTIIAKVRIITSKERITALRT